MSNTSDKLREFCENWRSDLIKHGGIPEMLSDLTALISEDYYPKEFVEWMMMGGHVGIYDRRGYLYSSALLNLKGFTGENTIDNLFNYWKENEQ